MENSVPPPNSQPTYSPYFSSEKELLQDVAKAQTRIDIHDKDIDDLKKECAALRAQLSSLRERIAYYAGGLGVLAVALKLGNFF